MPVDMSMLTQKDRATVQEVMHREQLAAFVLRSCLNCDSWAPNGAKASPELCTRFNAAPPADTIVFGCQFWAADIPF